MGPSFEPFDDPMGVPEDEIEPDRQGGMGEWGKYQHGHQESVKRPALRYIW
jgi:hypothetical protein